MIPFIAVLIVTASLLASMSLLLEEKINFNNPSLYFYYTLSVIAGFLNNKFAFDYFMIINTSIVFIWLAKVVFKTELREAISLGIFSVLLGLLAEAIVLFIDKIALSSIDHENLIYILLTNIGISMFWVFMAKLKGIKSLYKKILATTKNINEIQIIILSFFVIGVYNIFVVMSYYASAHTLARYDLTFSSGILTIVSAVILLSYFKSQNKYLKVYEKYNLSLESIREYEEILEKYRIYSHENKNQLMTIRNLCKNRKAIDYIDALIGNKLIDDDQILTETSKIPNGGLRGLIYSKLLFIKEHKIDFELLVDKKLNAAKIRKLDDSMLTDICMIVGVLLDNAIEAVKNLSERYIIIELYTEKGNISVAITNNYTEYFDVDKIVERGYSTKPGARGYGLALADKLIKENHRLENTKEFVEDNFTQILVIKKEKTSFKN